jgi:hypothetical protein
VRGNGGIAPHILVEVSRRLHVPASLSPAPVGQGALGVTGGRGGNIVAAVGNRGPVVQPAGCQVVTKMYKYVFRTVTVSGLAGTKGEILPPPSPGNIIRKHALAVCLMQIPTKFY